MMALVARIRIMVRTMRPLPRRLRPHRPPRLRLRLLFPGLDLRLLRLPPVPVNLNVLPRNHLATPVVDEVYEGLCGKFKLWCDG